MSFGGGREIFHGVPASRPHPEKSFEEVRYDDYLSSYQKTGKPPVPCPPLPLDAHQRSVLGLPALFQPHVELASFGGTSTYPGNVTMIDVFAAAADATSAVAAAGTITDPAALPSTQIFNQTLEGTDKFQSIVVQNEYKHFSPEELRYHAYARGNKFPPTPIPQSSTSLAIPQSSLLPFTPVKSSPLATTPLSIAGDPKENIQSISGQEEYKYHSVEELRIAYLLHNRQLTSLEIFQSLNQSPPASSTSPSPPSGPIPQPTQPTLFGRPPLSISSTFSPAATSSPAPVRTYSGTAAPAFSFGLSGPAQPPSLSSPSLFATPAPPQAPTSTLFGTPAPITATAGPSLFGTPAGTPGQSSSFGTPSAGGASGGGTGSLFGGTSFGARKF